MRTWFFAEPSANTTAAVFVGAEETLPVDLNYDFRFNFICSYPDARSDGKKGTFFLLFRGRGKKMKTKRNENKKGPENKRVL